MTSHAAPTTRQRIPARFATGLLIGGTVLGAAYGYGLLVEASPAFGPAVDPAPSIIRGTAGGVVLEGAPGLALEPGSPVDVADGVVPGGTSVFVDDLPGVANLAPDLLAALRRAATDAGAEGIAIKIDSGWRSSSYQAELFRQAVAQYGSEAVAARWVARPGTSTHESGSAVDVGSSDAAAWLAARGAAYDLCQVYANEPWHYEVRPGAAATGCPAMYASAAEDPRTQP